MQVSQTFAELFAFESVEEGVFEAPARTEVREHAFGGAIVAQSLVAAVRTVSADRVAHSVHCHFLRPGDTTAPTRITVTSLRDGRSYSTRSVVAEQQGKTIFAMTAAFHITEEGWEHQTAVMDAADPETLPTLEQRSATAEENTSSWLSQLAERHPFDIRFGETLPRDGGTSPSMSFWFRCTEDVGDDEGTHAGVLLYMSDLLLLSTALRPHQHQPGGQQSDNVSLDHAVWLHQKVRVDEWLRFDMDGPWTGHGRALSGGRIFDRSGTLVATIMQEGMARLRPPR